MAEQSGYNCIVDSYLAVDLEMTGLNPKMDEIIEIGAVKVVKGQIVERFQRLVRPVHEVTERITEITGLTAADLERAPEIDTVIYEFLEFAGELPLLGHGLIHDFSFLKKAAVDRKLKFERQGIDTLRIARVLLPELESRTLSALTEYFGIPHEAHRALGDAEATVELYNRLVSLWLERKGCEVERDADSGMIRATEEDVYMLSSPLIFKVKRDVPITKAQKERLLRLLQDKGITPDCDISRLKRSEADRIIDKILAGIDIEKAFR